MLVSLSSDREERVAVGAQLRVDGVDIEVERSRRHKGKWLVTFVGCTSRESVERWSGHVLEAVAIDEPETLWVHTVVGRSVVSVGTAGGPDVVHGTVASVLDNPAHDLLVLDSGALVPVVFIVDDTDPTRLVIDPPEGLFDS